MNRAALALVALAIACGGGAEPGSLRDQRTHANPLGYAEWQVPLAGEPWTIHSQECTFGGGAPVCSETTWRRYKVIDGTLVIGEITLPAGIDPNEHEINGRVVTPSGPDR